MDPEEPIHVDTATVRCDGGGPMGHPDVSLDVGKKGRAVCPYCGGTYILNEDAAPASGH
jgi:uncharacterized Zn-finger protein